MPFRNAPSQNRDCVAPAIPASEVIEWDVANWSPSLSFWESYVRGADRLDCLELGARRGGLSLWMAARGHRVICSDIVSPRETAQPLHERYGVAGLVEYEAMDAVEIPYTGRFDVILFKSMLGAVGNGGRLDKQRLAIEQMHKALRPGGVVLFAENLAGSFVHTYCREHFVPWGRKWRYVSLDELKSFFTSFSSMRYLTKGFLGAFGQSESQRRWLASGDRVFDRLLPESSRYIAIGAAVK
jgi:SAM-dependent methyltransferase